MDVTGKCTVWLVNILLETFITFSYTRLDCTDLSGGEDSITNIVVG